MITNTITRAAAGVCLVATAALHPLTAHAAAADYRFEVAEVKPAATGKSDVTLRLIHTPDKKPVSGCGPFRDHGRYGTGRHADDDGTGKSAAGSQPGLYIVEIEPGMAGNWALQVAAKVQGETRDRARLASRQTREMTCARPHLLAAGIVTRHHMRGLSIRRARRMETNRSAPRSRGCWP